MNLRETRALPLVRVKSRGAKATVALPLLWKDESDNQARRVRARRVGRLALYVGLWLFAVAFVATQMDIM